MSEGMEVRKRSPDGMACDAGAELGTCPPHLQLGERRMPFRR